MTNEETLQGLKNKELGLFKVFVDTVNKLGLRYYLIGGTLLGAVRHKGFIPWDDDIDVAMPREDYEIWLKEAPALIDNDAYFIQSVLSEPDYIANFAKIRDNKTTFIEITTSKTKINHGVYIDIFPLDYYPDSKLAQKLFDLKKLILTFKIQTAFCLDGLNFPKSKKIRNDIIAAFIPFSVKGAVRKREKLYKSVKASSLYANFSGAWGKKEICDKDWFGNGAEGEFEGMKVSLPSDYTKLLTQVYGNYMQFPPVEKRVPHHFTTVIDLEKPYYCYTEQNNEKQ